MGRPCFKRTMCARNVYLHQSWPGLGNHVMNPDEMDTFVPEAHLAESSSVEPVSANFAMQLPSPEAAPSERADLDAEVSPVEASCSVQVAPIRFFHISYRLRWADFCADACACAV